LSLVLTAGSIGASGGTGFRNKREQLDSTPQIGRISSNSDGDFVFVRKNKPRESTR
jgi:hypothetical protein